MVYEIIWLPEAIDSYLAIIDYLEKEWTDKEIVKFTAEVNKKFKVLEQQPRIGRISSKKHNVFRTQVHKKISLIYRLKPIKKEIELITFGTTCKILNE